MASSNCEMTGFVNSQIVLAVKRDLECSCEKACVGFLPVLCRLCVGNEGGSVCRGSAIYGILSIGLFL